MITRASIAIYDPRRLSPEDFLSGFVARQEIAGFLLNRLKQTPSDEIAEHRLIIGQRGMGKTSLLRRVAIGIAQDADLAERFIPLSFREEQYNVRSLGRFWRNCGESLAEWCETAGKGDIATDLDRKLLEPAWCEGKTAAEAFLAETSALDGRPVLFIDNLDIILDALPPQEQWALRKTLQSPGGPIIYGAATRFLSQSGDRDGAFYEFFHPYLLEPLTENELLRCMLRLADVRGEAGAPVRNILAREPERLRTLHTLTGGNPRVLALVYQLLERSESNEVFSDLEALLDQLTPFYKARIEEYSSDQQRAIIDAIALNWDPITSHNIGKVTAIEVTTVSSQLSRLRNDGLIEEVPTSSARAGYQFIERFFNIWYLMRHGTRRTRQKISWLTAFLKSFYARDELARMKLEAVTSSKSRYHKFYVAALGAALEGVPVPELDSRGLADVAIVAEKGDVRASLSQAPVHDVEVSREFLRKFALVGKHATLVKEGRAEEVLANIEEMLTVFDKIPALAVSAATALVLYVKGTVLKELGRSGEAIAAYDRLIANSLQSNAPSLSPTAAMAYFSKGVVLTSLNRDEEALRSYDEITSRFGATTESPLPEYVGRALVNSGLALRRLGRLTEAIAVFDEIIRRFSTTGELLLKEYVIKAFTMKGMTLYSMNFGDQAGAIFDEIGRRFGHVSELRESVAKALVLKAVQLESAGRMDEAIAALEEVVEQFGSVAEPKVREVVASTFLGKIVFLDKMGRVGDVIGECDRLISRLENSTDLPSQLAVGRAYAFKTVKLHQMGNQEEAIDVCNKFINSIRNGAPAPIQEIHASVILAKSAILDEQGRSEEAVECYEKVLERWGTTTEAPLSVQVTRSLAGKGIALQRSGRNVEAIESYDLATKRPGALTDPALREHIWAALFNKGALLDRLGRLDEAEFSFRQAILADSSNSVVRISLANLLVDKVGRIEEAELLYRAALEISDEDQMAKANLAWLLLGAGRSSEAALLRVQLGNFDPVGLELLDAASEFLADNFGTGAAHLDTALNYSSPALTTVFFDDLLRLFRIARSCGYGENLVEWFDKTGHASKRLPVYAALVAFIRGQKFLFDFNPEVRSAAQDIYNWLTARDSGSRAQPKKQFSKRHGGRPRKSREQK